MSSTSATVTGDGTSSHPPPFPMRTRHNVRPEFEHGDSEGSRSRHCLGSDEADRLAEAKDANISILSSDEQASQTVTPFLQQHIPQQYDPLGGESQPQQMDGSNTRFCYRHRPDLKCRRQADEPSMEQLQTVSNKFSVRPASRLFMLCAFGMF